MKRLFRTVLGLAFLLPSMALVAATNEPSPAEKASANLASLFDDPVIARCKGVEVKRSQVEEAFMAYKGRMAERKQMLPEGQRPYVEKQLLDGLIVTKILVQRASPEDQAKAKAKAEQIMGTYRTNAGSEETLRRQLKIRGTTLERFSADVLEEEIARSVMDRELRSTLKVGEAQVVDFYQNGVDAVVKIMQDELERLAKEPTATPVQLAATKRKIDDLKQANLAKLQLPEKVRVSHILIAARDRTSEEELPEEKKKAKYEIAQQLLTRARAGENWTNLVEQYSEDRNLPVTHGEYLMSRNDPFVAEFKLASFSLTNSQISDIVTTVFGYHIIKLLDRYPAKKVGLEKAADEIRNALLEQEFENQMPEYFAKVKKDAGVEILDPKYRFAATALELRKEKAENITSGQSLKAN